MENGRYPNKLKMFRRTQGYSQKKVARLLQLTDTSMLSRWEHGTVLPSFMNVLRLARIYHTEPSKIYEPLWDQVVADQNLLPELGEL